MAYAVRNHGMSSRGIFNGYFASHPRNYSADFISHEKENCVEAAASRTVSRRNILPNSARNFPAKNKYSAPRDNVTSNETFCAQTRLVSSCPYRKTIR